MKEIEAMRGIPGSVDQQNRILLWSFLSGLSSTNRLTPRNFPCISKLKVYAITLPVHCTANSFSLLDCLSSMADSDSRVSVRCGGNDVIEGNGSISIEPSCTEIVIVRHGETDWNAFGKMQGQLDVELNEVGRQQALAVADRLSREMTNISAVYSSDLKRALVTAEIIACKCGGLEVIADKDLRERHLGVLQGLVYHDLAKLNRKASEAFRSPRSDQEIPGGGESRDQLYNRCTSALQRIHEKHRGQQVIVVTHGGVIRSLYNRAVPHGPLAKKIMNTSVGIILVSGDRWSVKSWNDISHLTETGFLKSGFGGDASSG
ncbi:hypothetical protein Cgig2_002784 [Carnegiea gigantea]|uniref:Phosphoglycerate mutase n=1 Tax=Carnegiea gigantea TaxID=171969 RepID=A0A9Q1QLE8_9CARY|nr:hypothetical protein Cgig2_002784 [Carnegiea gigantea]